MGSIYEEVGGAVSGEAESRSNNKNGKMRMDDLDLAMQLQSIIDEEAPMKRKMTKPNASWCQEEKLMNEAFGGARSK